MLALLPIAPAYTSKSCWTDLSLASSNLTSSRRCTLSWWPLLSFFGGFSIAGMRKQIVYQGSRNETNDRIAMGNKGTIKKLRTRTNGVNGKVDNGIQRCERCPNSPIATHIVFSDILFLAVCDSCAAEASQDKYTTGHGRLWVQPIESLQAP